MWHVGQSGCGVGNGKHTGHQLRALLILVLVYPFYMSVLQQSRHVQCAGRSCGSLASTRLLSPYAVTSYHADAPPAADSIVRPPFRVVFTMSTLPHQVQYVNETLTSLAQQATEA